MALILKMMLNRQPPIDRLFHALADPARRTMIEHLSRGPLAMSALAKPLPMSLPAALQHLRVLEQAGLVTSQKSGRVRTCALDPAALGRLENWIGARRTEWEARLDRLGEYLASLENDGGNDGRTG